MIVLVVLTYVVEVYTGDVRFAGTNANVHLMIVGERGDTGRRQLRQSLSAKKDKFEAGNVRFTEKPFSQFKQFSKNS